MIIILRHASFENLKCSAEKGHCLTIIAVSIVSQATQVADITC